MEKKMENINFQYGVVLETSAASLTQGGGYLYMESGCYRFGVRA